jgi:deoxycytidine triphosphate deaminase
LLTVNNSALCSLFVRRLDVEPMSAARENVAQPTVAVTTERVPVLTLVTGSRLRDAVERRTFIKGGDLNSVEGVKYDFRMGSRVLKATYSQPIDMEELPVVERSAMRVDPGEAVFVLTKEHLNLPGNFMAVLSPKRRLAHGGIIILGGFSVDPLYRGPLWLGLYNCIRNEEKLS